MPINIPQGLQKTGGIIIPEGLAKKAKEEVIPSVNTPIGLEPSKFNPYTFSRNLAVDIGMTMVSPNTMMQVFDQPEPVQDFTEEIFGEMAMGYGKGLTFGLSEFAMTKALEGGGFEKPEVSTVGDVANRVGSLLGMWKAIGGVGKLAPFRWLAGLKPTSKVGILAHRMVNSGMRLGAYSALSEWGGRELKENLKSRGIAGLHGGGIGMLFGAIGSIAVKPSATMSVGMQRALGFSTLAVRMGLNQLLTGVPAAQRYKMGDESIPGLAYEIGLGIMFSMSNNPLLVEHEFNNSVKRNNKLKNLSLKELNIAVEKLGDYRKVPSDLKWAYIMKQTRGKVKPDYKNVVSTDQIFEQVLAKRSPEVATKLNFLRDITKGIELEMQGVSTKKQLPPGVKMVDINKLKVAPVGGMDINADINKLVNKRATPQDIDDAVRKIVKRNPKLDINKVREYMVKWENDINKYTADMEAGADFPPVKVQIVDGKMQIVDGYRRYVAARRIGAKGIPVEVEQAPKEKPKFDISRKQDGFRGANTLAYSIKQSNPATYIPIQDQMVENEVLTDMGIPKTPIHQAKPGTKMPKQNNIILPDFYEWSKTKGNILEWFQTARLPLKPIYDVFKPAYEKYILTRTVQYDRMRKIYGNRVKQGSTVDKLIAKYSDGQIPIEKVPAQYRDIAKGRVQFYQEYADRLMKMGLLPKNRVFNKDGTRKLYYHRMFERMINEDIFNAGFALEDFYMPGEMPLAGPLKQRTGQKAYEYSAIKSDTQYIYAIEKYINMFQANKAATQMAKTIKSPTRRDMANNFIRHMRGQPTKADVQIKETLEGMVRHTGTLLGNKKLAKWDAPTYPISRIASPLARLYYWRFVGMGVDTAMKNSIQFHHAVARYGGDNAGWAMGAQFTPEGKRLIQQSGIHNESIKRGGAFIEETMGSKALSKVEKGSYYLWSMFDINNRNISGLSAYKWARSKGMSHPQAIKEMRKGSHETQYGYTKADSLLMDMRSPFSRFILFKKWPLAKVEMIRSWARDGQHEAIMNLAMLEYGMFRVAQAAGMDLSSYFGSMWQLATRGLEGPSNLFPVVSDTITGVHAIFGKGEEQRKALSKLRKDWRMAGNRWLGKAANLYQSWQDGWNVRELEDGTWNINDMDAYRKGKLKYGKEQVSAQSQMMGLFFRPVEQTKQYQKTKRMIDIGNMIKETRRRILTEVTYGDPDKAAKMLLEIINKYGDEYAQEFGKALKPEDIVNMDTIKSFIQGHETPTVERVRARMPGKNLIKVPPGMEFKGKPKKKGVIEHVRGF